MSYTQLTEEERIEIYALKKAGMKQCQIARQLGRHPSTICNEFKRNTGQRGYRPRQAHNKAIQRRKEKVSQRIKPTSWAQVTSLLRLGLSPEQVCGRLAFENQATVSHERIYQYVYEDKAQGGDLHIFLRCQKQHKKRYGSHSRRGIPTRLVLMSVQKWSKNAAELAIGKVIRLLAKVVLGQLFHWLRELHDLHF